MKKIITMAILPILIALSFSISTFALTVDGVLYDKTMRCLIVTGGFGKYPGTNASLNNDNGHTANLIGSSGTPIASYGYWYNSVLGITRSKQVGAGSYVNGNFDGYVKKSTWQDNNSNTGTGYQGTISSSYRGIDRSIDRDLVTTPFIPSADNLVWSFFLQKNTASASITGLDTADQALAAMTIRGTGLPNATTYGSTSTFSKAGTTSLNETVLYGSYYASFFIPNASKYNITYRVTYTRGNKLKSLSNTVNIYNFSGPAASFSSALYYVESGGYLNVAVTVTKKSGTVITDLRLGTGVTESYANKTFNLYSSTGSFIKSATTDTNGYAYFYTMPYATYSIRANAAPSGNYYTPTSTNVTLSGNSVTGVFTMYRNTGTLEIRYSTEDSLGLSNTQFKITNPNGTVSYHTTSSSGQILLSGVITGSYQIEQTTASPDYEKAPKITATVNTSATTSVSVYNPILYDFSVQINVPATVKVNEPIAVIVLVRNKGGKAASNAVVKIMYQGSLILSGLYNIPANSSITVATSVLSLLPGSKSFRASVNELNEKRETNMSDNIDSGVTDVGMSTNLQIEYLNTNGEYREGTEVISSFRVKNNGTTDILPANNLKVNLSVKYNGESVTAMTRTSVVIPANGDNIVYFRWTVAFGTAGMAYTVSATVNPDNTVTESNSADNTATAMKTIIISNTSVPPNTRFEKTTHSDFLLMDPPELPDIKNATWSEWVYESGAFVKKTYGLSLDTATVYITPDINSPSKKLIDGTWSMGSGYGFTSMWNVTTSTPTGLLAPDSSAFTGAQAASAYFPEFMYSTEIGYYRSFSKLGTNSFRFAPNTYALNNARIHYTPLWFPDGDYFLQGFAGDLWTPAGMMYGYAKSNRLIISKSALDDWYTGR